jgi:hypothetical protein
VTLEVKNEVALAKREKTKICQCRKWQDTVQQKQVEKSGTGKTEKKDKMPVRTGETG